MPVHVANIPGQRPPPASPGQRQVPQAWQNQQAVSPASPAPRLHAPAPQHDGQLRPLADTWQAFPQPPPSFPLPDGSPLSRPPTESPGLLERVGQGLLPKGLFDEIRMGGAATP